VKNFQAPKSVHQDTTIYQQSTTISPSKHHIENAHSPQNPPQKSAFTTPEKTLSICD
jgi:hypothetical protein